MAKTQEEERAYHAEWQREYRKRNGEHVRGLERARRSRNPERHRRAERERYAREKVARQEWMNETKSFLGCFVCGDDHSHRLEWHHLTPLRDSDPRTRVASIAHAKGIDAALGEATTRCVLLCANCHKDVHYRMEDAPNGL